MKFSDPVRGTVIALAERYLRPVTSWTGDASGEMTPVFEPPLSAAEQATYADIVTLATATQTMTPTDYAAVRTQMQQLRSTRQLGRPAFLALTTAQQMRILYDDDVATAEILLKLFRDS